jgi:hypothetical protein
MGVHAARPAVAGTGTRPVSAETLARQRREVLRSAAGLGPLGRIAAVLVRDLDICVDQAVRRIVTEVDTYGSGSRVPHAELWRSIQGNLEFMLVLLVERRAATPPEARLFNRLGRRRAQAGVPHDHVVRAMQLAQGVLWDRLTIAAAGLGALSAQELLQEAARMWVQFDELCAETVRGHCETLARLDLGVRQNAVELLTGLRRTPRPGDRLVELARSLGFDPQGPFLAAVLPPETASLPALTAPVTLIVDEPQRATVLVQDTTPDEAAESTLAADLRAAGCTPGGVGIQRAGLHGAHLSLRDAEAAATAARQVGEHIVHFRASWLVCLALSHRQQHDDLLAPSLRALARDPDLRATLDAYVAAEANLAATGRALGVHPNTVAYRLRQFADRTGVDPRTAAGLTLLQVALPLVDPDADQPDGGTAAGPNAWIDPPLPSIP